jgi:hypothetical protein
LWSAGNGLAPLLNKTGLNNLSQPDLDPTLAHPSRHRRDETYFSAAQASWMRAQAVLRISSLVA